MNRWLHALMTLMAIPLLACNSSTTLYEQARTTPFQTVARLDGTLQATSGDPFAYTAANSTTVTLPEDAQQGVPGWFVLDATLRVSFTEGAPADAIDYVSVATNGFAVALIEFRPDKAHLVRWMSTEQFTGAASGVVQGKTFEFRYRNYLQLRGVKEGSNTLSVHLDHLGAPLIERVELLAGSSIDFTALPPPSLSLERADADTGALSARVNEPFEIRLVVRSNGLPIRQVRFSTTPSSPSVEIVEPVPTLERAYDESVVVRVKGTRPGTYTITIVASGSLGGAKTVEIPVEIRP